MTETTINYKGINLIVQGYYEKGEEAVMYYGDMSGYPGSPSDFHIEFIFVEDSEINIFDFFGEKDLEEIVRLVIENIEE